MVNYILLEIICFIQQGFVRFVSLLLMHLWTKGCRLIASATMFLHAGMYLMLKLYGSSLATHLYSHIELWVCKDVGQWVVIHLDSEKIALQPVIELITDRPL